MYKDLCKATLLHLEVVSIFVTLCSRAILIYISWKSNLQSYEHEGSLILMFSQQ